MIAVFLSAESGEHRMDRTLSTCLNRMQAFDKGLRGVEWF